ncbi:OLC1v1002855C1 [Oldenlandia corymbosa var. corymbosa]|uniref:OLC1v1002855C1 n=1 Tax=Oldenlandia corymbosa var. corymbosa TaxID=529605 RepID=A0AAV1D8P5_OLDCO|nr:OLC1v1002855C1 [Oldenlandia corymbosa var. corymbosa]
MASFHVSLKSSISPFSVSQSQYSPSRWSYFCSEFSSTVSLGRNFGRGSRKLRPMILPRRFRISSSSTKESPDQSNGEEPPESLFMKELKKRGMTPTSVLEDSKKSSNAGDETNYREEDGGFSTRNTVSMDAETKLKNQLEESRALNSEGLEGLIPRAKLLLTLGGTFFLAFWPLILITVAFTTGLYLYFGTSFIHDGRDSNINIPEYIDPYQLLEEERLSQTAPRLY